MKESKPPEPIFAVCINNRDYPASLELHKIYRVLPNEDAAEDGDIRVVDESGEDYFRRRFVKGDCGTDKNGGLPRGHESGTVDPRIPLLS